MKTKKENETEIEKERLSDRATNQIYHTILTLGCAIGIPSIIGLSILTYKDSKREPKNQESTEYTSVITQRLGDSIDLYQPTTNSIFYAIQKKEVQPLQKGYLIGTVALKSIDTIAENGCAHLEVQGIRNWKWVDKLEYETERVNSLSGQQMRSGMGRIDEIYRGLGNIPEFSTISKVKLSLNQKYVQALPEVKNESN